MLEAKERATAAEARAEELADESSKLITCDVLLSPAQHAGHPGAGTAAIDGAFSAALLERIDALVARLPVAPKEKPSPIDRSYFHDVEGWLVDAIAAAADAAAAVDAAVDAAATADAAVDAAATADAAVDAAADAAAAVDAAATADRATSAGTTSDSAATDVADASIGGVVVAVGASGAVETSDARGAACTRRRAVVLPRMRLLRYVQPGGQLPPHTDLPRTHTVAAAATAIAAQMSGGSGADASCSTETGNCSGGGSAIGDGSGSGDRGTMETTRQARSTHTFLLYAGDYVGDGGETLLLEAKPGDAALARAGGLAAGPRATLARVAPRRGRLLLMPHACPHAAAPTAVSAHDLKVVVRGELFFE